MDQIDSAGAPRPAATFVGQDGPMNLPAGEVGAIYITHEYRVAVFVVAPPLLFTDPSFAAEVQDFFEHGVVLP
jgi:hypothetical protein